jgi:hypothetical protein
MIDSLAWGAVLMGAWTPTGERTAVVTLVLNELQDDQLWQGQGRVTAEVDETDPAIILDRSG